MKTSYSTGRLTEVTTDDLSKRIMHECRISGLPVCDQATALGATYACYLITKGVTPQELRVFLDKAIAIVEEVQRAVGCPPQIDPSIQ